VKKEMETKGLDTQVADKIGHWVQRKGGDDIIEFLKTDETLSKNEDVCKGVQDMEKLFEYLDAFGARKRISFDLSLARGLDYYTGVIYGGFCASSSRPATRDWCRKCCRRWPL
jgi:histidyl-tRNA synthetase